MRGYTAPSGIRKRAVLKPVHVGRLGLAGDTVVDGDNHGGADQAVYVFGSEDYDWWSQQRRRVLEPGTFGENLTVDGLESANFAVGDRLEIGSGVVLEVTAPRTPCRKLAARMADPRFNERFRAMERPGFYCRVIAEGEVRMGDAVSHTPYDGERVGIIELFRDHFAGRPPEAALRRFLAAPLADRLRREKTQQLEALTAPSFGLFTLGPHGGPMFRE